MAKQTTLGKAFEYACVEALRNRYATIQEVVVSETPQMETARQCFLEAGEQAENLKSGAKAAVNVIDRLEPRLRDADGDTPLILSVQADAAGMGGDVRDVLCIRKGKRWEIGLSCKHNHHAVKHSRLSATIDFGQEWFGHPCSNDYFDRVVPLFEELRRIRDDGVQTGEQVLWRDVEDKVDRYYKPVLNAFVDELLRLSKEFPDVPEKLIRYLIGKYDFYKVITNDVRRFTRIEVINIAGNLNKPSVKSKPAVVAPPLKVPHRFYHIGFKEDSHGTKSDNTILVVCDNGWEISMRIHNASSRVEPSLKFDVQLVSFPSDLYTHTEFWD